MNNKLTQKEMNIVKNIARNESIANEGFGKVTDFPEEDLCQFYDKCDWFFHDLKLKGVINQETYGYYKEINKIQRLKLGQRREGEI